ncbi:MULTISPECIES: 3-phosphoshikimate 1-carboxyvinyltransferase [Streptomyces violaceusniger group]|uniref:hypothetical protein n=1 Tax=Streptomyces violaceusniger group TaxID=2839105 RepID=UPI0023EA72A3|nr:hypothetical protein [Streptomyces rhizosphaericus]
MRVDVSENGRRFDIEPGQCPTPATVVLPPDVGAAAFGLAVTALHPADVLFRGLPALPVDQVDHPEADLLNIVAGMGLPMTADPATGMVRVRHDGIRLRPARIDCRAVPDTLPALSVLGALADGTTVLDNVAQVVRPVHEGLVGLGQSRTSRSEPHSPGQSVQSVRSV